MDELVDSTFDKMFYPEAQLLGGIDESGVSDIAGPLVAACVILPHIDTRRDDLKIFEVDDSKEIHKRWRKKHAEVIWQTALAIGIGEVSPTEFDFLSRQDATALAMFRAVVACKSTRNGRVVKPGFLIVDGDFPANVATRQAVIRDADAKSLCCASASIIAKVYRDGIMDKLHERYPFYDWINNKGAPNEYHFRGIDQHGIQAGIHRVRKWPFITNPQYAEDHIVWRRRRRVWRRVTLEKLGNEVGEGLWTQRPPLWTPLPNSRLQPQRVERSGSDTRD